MTSTSMTTPGQTPGRHSRRLSLHASHSVGGATPAGGQTSDDDGEPQHRSPVAPALPCPHVLVLINKKLKYDSRFPTTSLPLTHSGLKPGAFELADHDQTRHSQASRRGGRERWWRWRRAVAR